MQSVDLVLTQCSSLEMTSGVYLVCTAVPWCACLCAGGGEGCVQHGHGIWMAHGHGHDHNHGHVLDTERHGRILQLYMVILISHFQRLASSVQVDNTLPQCGFLTRQPEGIPLHPPQLQYFY